MGLFDFFKEDTSVSQITKPGKVTTSEVFANDITRDELNRCFIAFDIETTGGSNDDRIIELGAVKYVDGIKHSSFGTLVKTDVPVSLFARKKNNISDEMIARDGKTEDSAYIDFVEFLGECLDEKIIMCAHNASFDMRFLSRTLMRLGYSGSIKYIDTLEMSRQAFPSLVNHQQATVADCFGIVNKKAHRAETDAETCGEILINLLKIDVDYGNSSSISQKKKEPTISEKNIPNDEEKEVCAIVMDILRKSNCLIDRLRFYKNSDKYIDVLFDYEILKFKLSKKGHYIILPSRMVKGISFRTADCTGKEGENNIRVFFDSPFDLYNLSEIITEYVNFTIEFDNLNNSTNKYEKAFFEKGNFTKISNVEELLENAKKREEIRKKSLAEKQKNQEELEKEKRIRREKEKNRIKIEMEELLKNVGEYSLETIKAIVELSELQNKRAIIKMDDDGNIYNVYDSVSAACRDMKLDSKTIRSVASGKGKHAGGYCWKYADDYLEYIAEQ